MCKVGDGFDEIVIGGEVVAVHHHQKPRKGNDSGVERKLENRRFILLPRDIVLGAEIIGESEGRHDENEETVDCGRCSLGESYTDFHR
jgi:hypothetical protein